MASKYSNKSLAEQNSLDLAWELLMEGKFRYVQDGTGTSCYCSLLTDYLFPSTPSNLRSCLFASQGEVMRFRQLIVNVVLATDIFDKEVSFSIANPEQKLDFRMLTGMIPNSSTTCANVGGTRPFP
jgi:hypothetical protein